MPVSVNRHRDRVVPKLLLHIRRAIVLHEQDARVCVAEILWVPDSEFYESIDAFERFLYDPLCNLREKVGHILRFAQSFLAKIKNMPFQFPSRICLSLL